MFGYVRLTLSPIKLQNIHDTISPKVPDLCWTGHVSCLPPNIWPATVCGWRKSLVTSFAWWFGDGSWEFFNSLTMIIKLEVFSPSRARNRECWNHYLALHLTIDSSFHLLNVVSGWNSPYFTNPLCVFCVLYLHWKWWKKHQIWVKLYPNAPVNTYPRKLQHTPRTHPKQSPVRQLWKESLHSLLVKVARGVFQRCGETTLDISEVGWK